MLVHDLCKVFRDRVYEHSYFDHWVVEKPREFWDRDEVRCCGIEVQLGKWWKKTGGQVAVNLWCGHRWKNSIGPSSEGFDYESCRLGSLSDQDRWWRVSSAKDIDAFGIELNALLKGEAIPWFSQVSSKEGFLDWASSVFPVSHCFPYVLEVCGVETLSVRVRHWLLTAPRDVGNYLEWLVEIEVISKPLADQIYKASIQTDEEYRLRLPALIEEIG